MLGTDVFTYQVSDGLLFSNIASVTITVRPVNYAPVGVNDVYSTLRAETLTIPAPGVLGNDTDPNVTDTLTAVLVQTTAHGTLVLNANGSFVYTPVTTFVGADTFTYRAFDGMLFSAITTVTINVLDIAPTTVQLDRMSDTGISDTDHITKDNSPTYRGTAPALFEVRLFGRPQGSSTTPTLLGTTTADISGNWAITSSTLPDGVYDITAASYYANGISTGVVNGGPITIDTVGPTVVAATLNLRTGQVSVTYTDDRSGMEQGSISNPLNYNFGVLHIKAAAPILIRSVRALPTLSPTSPQTVLIDVSGGMKLLSHTYVFGILTGGVVDVAGNGLSGNFDGSFPSGQGSKVASDFKAQFNPTSQVFANALPTLLPVFITPPGSPTGVIHTVIPTKHKHIRGSAHKVTTHATVPTGPVVKTSVRRVTK